MRVRAPRRAARTHNAYATCTRRLGARLAAWNLRPLDIFCGPVGSGRVRFVCLVRSAYIIVVFVRAARPAQTIVHNGLDRECVAAKEQARRERCDAPISVDAQEEYVLCERSHSSVYTADRFMPGIHIEVVVVV